MGNRFSYILGESQKREECQVGDLGTASLGMCWASFQHLGGGKNSQSGMANGSISLGSDQGEKECSDGAQSWQTRDSMAAMGTTVAESLRETGSQDNKGAPLG